MYNKLENGILSGLIAFIALLILLGCVGLGVAIGQGLAELKTTTITPEQCLSVCEEQFEKMGC